MTTSPPDVPAMCAQQRLLQQYLADSDDDTFHLSPLSSCGITPREGRSRPDTPRRPATPTAAATDRPTTPAPIAAAAAPSTLIGSTAVRWAATAGARRSPTPAVAQQPAQQTQQQQQQQQPVRVDPPSPANFFRQWLDVQVSKVNTASWLRVVEDVEVLQDGTWLPPRRRLLAVSLGGATKAASSSHAAVLEAGRALVAGRHADEVAAAKRKKVFQVLRFSSCHAIELATDSSLVYGRFPLLPHEPSSAGTFRASYLEMRIMSPEEIAQLPRPAAGAESQLTTEDAQAATRMWTSESAEGDAIVERVLSEFGTSLPLELRVADGVQRQAFRQLCASVLRGYRDATPEERDRKLRRLIALPRMHMRRLVGPASPRVRARFAAQQLSGLVCTQLAEAGEKKSARPERERSKNAEDEHADRCVRTAFKLASQNYIGRAAAALVRPLPVAIDAAQKIADLTALHPLGDEPQGVVLPPQPLFSTASIAVNGLRASVKGCMSGSAAGADGWTFEALHDALDHDEFATEFAAVVADICNGHVTTDTSRLLASSWLVGIPKGTTAADGTRPIALGSVLLKVAAARALAVATKTLQQRFRGSQFGCAAKGGGEFIVHSVRRFLRSGVRPNGSVAGPNRVIITLDFANAFNSPSRQAMWDACKDIPELAGIFGVSYGHHSPLYVVGTDTVLESARGARQGNVDGPVIFALTLQSVINAANACPDAQVLAYLDDVTILADSPAAADRIVDEFARRAADLGMALKPKKCEVIAANPFTSLFGCPTLEPFRRVRVVKLLGASIGMMESEEEAHLLEREGAKAETFMKRIRLGASPQLFTVLRQCGCPKLSYAIRVHSADVSRRLCQTFDARVEEVISYWASTPMLTERQRLITALPRSLGGMGLTRMELIAPAAFHASHTTALQGARRVPNQAALAAVVYRDVLDRTNDPELRRHLLVHSLDGTDAGLSFVGSRVHPDVFGAMLRTYLMADARTVAGATRSLPCRGCRHTFSVGGDWGQHVASCVTAPGGHVTKRHNAVASLLRRGLNEAGFQPDATEPRDLATYDCRCGLADIAHEAYIEHRKQCQQAGKQPLHISGPDIRYTANGMTTVADVTVVSLLTATHSQQSADDAFAAARAGKVLRYGAMCGRAGVRLLPLPASANGHLGPELIGLANQIADRSFRDRLTVRAELSAAIAHGSAVARLAAEESCGLRPASIALDQVRLLERFRHVPAESEAAPSNATTLPPLLPTPHPVASLEDRVALGVSRAMREMLPKLSVAWVEAARAAQAEAARLRNAESAERATAQPDEEPSAPADVVAAAIDAADAETEEFRVRVVSQAELDAVESRVLADRVAAEQAAELERATLRDAEAALKREADARMRQLATIEEQATRTASAARAQSERLQRAASVASARAQEAARESTELVSRLSAARDEAAVRLREARDSAKSVARAASEAQAQLEADKRQADNTLATAEAYRSASVARAQSVAAQLADETAQIAQAREQADKEAKHSQLQLRKSLASQHRERLSADRAAASMEPVTDLGAYTVLRAADAGRVTWASDEGMTPAPNAAVRPTQRPVAPKTPTPATTPAARQSSPSTARAQSIYMCDSESPIATSPVPQRSSSRSVRIATMHNPAAFLGPPAPASATSTDFDDDDYNNNNDNNNSPTASAGFGPYRGIEIFLADQNTSSQAGKSSSTAVAAAVASSVARSGASAIGSLCSAISSAVSRSRSATPSGAGKK